MYYDVETMLEGRFLKFWSYKYSNNICSFGIFVDVGCISLMFLCVIGLLVMAVGAWMNEYVIRCIIFEESRYINVEKYRYDWI